MHLLKLASLFQDVATIFARAEAKRIRATNVAEKLAGVFQACGFCNTDSDSKRCTGIIRCTAAVILIELTSSLVQIFWENYYFMC